LFDAKTRDGVIAKDIRHSCPFFPQAKSLDSNATDDFGDDVDLGGDDEEDDDGADPLDAKLRRKLVGSFHRLKTWYNNQGSISQNSVPARKLFAT
jgi:hypothetical protein